MAPKKTKPPRTSFDHSVERRAYDRAKRWCTKSDDRNYKNYGGRGIEFRFACFGDLLAEIGRRPAEANCLGRIDTCGHYETGNVEWSTRRKQQTKRRPYTLETRLKIILSVMRTKRVRRTVKAVVPDTYQKT